MEKCHSCGSEIEDETYCEVCGERVDSGEDSEKNNNSSEEQSKSHKLEDEMSRSERLNKSREEGILNFLYTYTVTMDLKSIGIGAILNILGFLLVPLFILSGYVYDSVRYSALPDQPNPEYGDFERHAKKGFAYFMVGFVPSVVLSVPIVAMQVFLDSLLISLMLPFLYIAIAYFSPALLTTYAVKGSVEETINSPEDILDFASSREYIVYFVAFIAIQSVAGFIAFFAVFVLFITLIGIPLIFILFIIAGSYVPYITGAYWGEVYRKYNTSSEDKSTANPTSLD